MDHNGWFQQAKSTEFILFSHSHGVMVEAIDLKMAYCNGDERYCIEYDHYIAGF